MGRREKGHKSIGEEIVRQFARAMRKRYGADLYLFGSRARGAAGSHSDYDIAAVSTAFAEQPDLFRALDRRRMWASVGGEALSLDLHCYTPEEFSRELESLGYLGEAHARGELLLVPVGLSDVA